MRTILLVLYIITNVVLVVLTPGFYSSAQATEYALPPLSKQKLPSHLVLAALGDSMIEGMYASSTCTEVVPIEGRACPNGMAFVDQLARFLDKIVPTQYQKIGTRGAYFIDIPLRQVEKISPDTNIVLIYSGRTDEQQVADIPGLNPHHYVLEQWEEDFSLAIARVKAKVPNARIILATFPNRTYLPDFLPGAKYAFDAATGAKMTQANVAMNDFIIRLGYETVDLRCDPASYDPALYFSGDSFHFNDAGYAVMAKMFFDVITYRVPGRARANCSPYTDISPPPSSVPSPRFYAALGDTITSGQFASRPGITAHLEPLVGLGTSYPALVGLALQSNGPVFAQILSLPGAFTTTVLDKEIPQLDPRTNWVTLFIGLNDVFLIAEHTTLPSLDQMTASWHSTFQAMVAAIHARAPSAKLVVANIPNLAFYPLLRENKAMTPVFAAKLTAASNAMNFAVNQLVNQGVIVVDLHCASEIYQDRAGFAQDVHPNDIGYAKMARLFIEAIHHPTLPQTSCPPY